MDNAKNTTGNAGGNAGANSRTIEIDGMSGDACVQKVTGALKGVQGVTTKTVKVGSATIEADQAGCAAACSSIGKAGYKARDTNQAGDRSKQAASTGTDTEMKPEASKDKGATPVALHD